MCNITQQPSLCTNVMSASNCYHAFYVLPSWEAAPCPCHQPVKTAGLCHPSGPRHQPCHHVDLLQLNQSFIANIPKAAKACAHPHESVRVMQCSYHHILPWIIHILVQFLLPGAKYFCPRASPRTISSRSPAVLKPYP